MASLKWSTRTISSSPLYAFDALVPHAEVSAPLCAAAAQGRLDLPADATWPSNNGYLKQGYNQG